MFAKGDRVYLNDVWKKHNLGQIGPNVMNATVQGLSRNRGCVRIIFDGKKTPTTYHQSFLSKL